MRGRGFVLSKISRCNCWFRGQRCKLEPTYLETNSSDLKLPLKIVARLIESNLKSLHKKEKNWRWSFDSKQTAILYSVTKSSHPTSTLELHQKECLLFTLDSNALQLQSINRSSPLISATRHNSLGVKSHLHFRIWPRKFDKERKQDKNCFS